MKNQKIFLAISFLTISLSYFSCTKEAGVKEVNKLSAADCPRLASLKGDKKEALYNVITFAGSSTSPRGYIEDGILCKAIFQSPHGVAVAADGTVYVSDYFAHNIRKIKQGMVSTFAGTTNGGGYIVGNNDGIGTDTRFNSPTKLILDKEGNLLLIDGEGGGLRKISPSAQVTTIISSKRELGYQDGPLAQAKFNGFRSIATGSDGSIYLFDNERVRKISPAGIVSTYADGKPVLNQPAIFYDVSDMAMGPDGYLYICNASNYKIFIIRRAGVIETYANVRGPNNSLYSIAISDKGQIFVSSFNQIFQLNKDGTARSIAGGGNYSGFKDGVGSEARFGFIVRIVIHENYLYVTDSGTIRRIKIE